MGYNRPSMPSTVDSSRKQIASAAAIVGSLYMVSRVLGFVRQTIFVYYFGIETPAANAYFLVSPIPDLIFNVIAGGALGSAFIPTFAAYFADEDNPDAAAGWQLFSTIVNLVLIVVTAVCLITAVIAPWLLSVLYPIRMTDPTLAADAVLLLRVWLISTVIFGASGVLMVALNARQHFLMPALATVVYNIGIIIGIMLFQPNVVGVGIGAALGALGHLLIQLPALRQVEGYYRPRIDMTPAVRQVGVLMAPRVAGLSFSYLNLLIIPRLAEAMEAGSEGALYLGSRIMLLPQSVLGQAIGVASFPTFATLAARADYPAMRRILSDTLRFILFLGAPIAVGMMLVRKPLIGLAFAYGRGDQAGTINMVAWALLFYATALIALSLLEVLVRAFYALKDTWTPVLAGAVQMVLLLGLGAWLGRVVFPANGWLALGGVALAYTIANWVEVAILLLLLRPKMHGIGGRILLDGSWRILAASGAMTAAVWLVTLTIGGWTGRIGYIGQLVVSGVVGAGVYAAACHFLRLREFGQLMAMVRRGR